MPATPTPLLDASGLPAGPADIRLIVTDMDGTLLDDAKRIPDGLWPMLAELRRRGVLFSPASGRQYATLFRQFEAVAEGMVFIAENGTYVVRDGVELSSDPLDRSVAAGVARTVRRLVADGADGADVGAVVCGKRAAYVERTDEPFLAEVRKYYVEHRIVEDVTAVDDEVIKVALFDFGSAEHTTAPALAAFAATHQVVVSGEHWVDVMNRTADKGAALRGLQRALGITPAQTMVFGDYLNDLEMLDAAEWSFAMEGAHPEVIRRARHLAPSNNDDGVLRTVARVLDLPYDGVRA
ncbi:MULTISPECIES: Cof-type HAD-IIB family hydrolase [Streptomyces]|uniref:Cof-type HAD-IIB family hydrolase n=1 Tax=Streptomyces TaxID=1883 RepID=UPI0004BD74CB|nr:MULTISPECIES: Cof-type HAD-IIB family hydrolase [Streptomyces]KOG68133.1 HAD family hydrolase [Streptomyces antibioticus]